MSGYDSSSSKRRRVGTADLDYAYVANPTTSRTKAAAQSRALQQADALRHHHHHQHANHAPNSTAQGPTLSFASLPPAALQRYLVR
ncbi:hypothetical protein JCM10212_000946, partial [Sporobolomyces blumeae]